MAVIYISHRLAEIYRIADTVTVLRDGALIDTKPVGDDRPAQPGEQHGGPGAEGHLPGQEARRTAARRCWRCGASPWSGEFEDVSFTLRKGEILGFAGLVGSGRTEVARTICGLYRKTRRGGVSHGEEALHPQLQGRHPPGHRLPHGGPRAKEGLFLDMSVAANISVISLDDVARIEAHPEAERARPGAEVRGRDADQGGQSSPQKLRSLSGGNQQKVLVSKLLSVVAEDRPHGRAHPGNRHRREDARSTTCCESWPPRASGSS